MRCCASTSLDVSSHSENLGSYIPISRRMGDTLFSFVLLYECSKMGILTVIMLSQIQCRDIARHAIQKSVGCWNQMRNILTCHAIDNAQSVVIDRPLPDIQGRAVCLGSWDRSAGYLAALWLRSHALDPRVRIPDCTGK